MQCLVSLILLTVALAQEPETCVSNVEEESSLLAAAARRSGNKTHVTESKFARTDDNITVLNVTVIPQSPEEGLAFDRDHFAALDADGDGNLAASEIQAGWFSSKKISELEHEGTLNVSASALRLSMQEVQDIIRRGDRDNSGTLTFEELETVLSREPSPVAMTQVNTSSIPCVNTNSWEGWKTCQRAVKVFFECNCKWEWECRGFMCSEGLNVWKCDQCFNWGSEPYQCWGTITSQVFAGFESCLTAITNEIKKKVPEDLLKVVDLIVGCGLDADACAKKIRESLQQLGNIVGEWLEKNLNQISATASAEFNKLEARATSAVNSIQGIGDKVQRSITEVGKFFSGTAPAANTNDYRLTDSEMCTPDGAGRPDFSISDCGVWDAMKKLVDEAVQVWTIDNNFKSVVDKMKQCIEKKSSGFPTPFMQISMTKVCIPNTIKEPVNAIVSTLRASVALGESSGFIQDVQSITKKLTSIAGNHLSLMQDRGLVAMSSGSQLRCSDFGMIVAEAALASSAPNTHAAVPIILQGRYMCIGGLVTEHISVNVGLDWDFLKVLTEDNSYKATFILALGWGQTANDKFFSSGALIKYKHPTGKGIAIDYLPLINGKVPSVKGFYATPLALSESATFEETVAAAARATQGMTSTELSQLHEAALQASNGHSAEQPARAGPAVVAGVVLNFCLTCLSTRPSGDWTGSSTPGVAVHWVNSCEQCGFSGCSPIGDWQPYYRVGVPVHEWGCEKVPANPLFVGRPNNGGIYIVQPAILHHVNHCTTCGSVNFCVNFFKDDPNLQSSGEFVIGATLPEWGCDKVGSNPVTAHDPSTGMVFFVTFEPLVLHHVSTCSDCGRTWCSGFWMDKAGLASSVDFVVGSTLAIWGCDKLGSNPIQVHDKSTGAVYVVEGL